MNPSTPGPSTVLVLGASGRFGGAVAAAFAKAGWRVIAQSRRGAHGLPPAVEPLEAGLDDLASLAGRVGRADVVVYAVNPTYTRWDAEAMPALRAGLDVASRLRARFMFPGNVYNFGADMPALLGEDTPQRPTTRKGEIRVAMEALVAARATAEGFPATIVRAGDFFGAGTGNWFDQAVAKSWRSGKLVYPGPLDVAHAWAYLPDLADAFVRLADRAPASAVEAFHFEGHTMSGRQLLDALERAARELGVAPAAGFSRSGMPWKAIGLVGLVFPLWRELWRMAYLWTVPHALDGRRLRERVGPGLGHTPLAAAIRASLVGLTPSSNAGADSPGSSA